MTETPQTTTPELAPEDVEPTEIDQLVLGIVQTGRVNMAGLRSLPKWRAVLYARLAWRARAIPRADLDRIVHEASFAGVKPAKLQLDVSDEAVEAMCECIYVGWEHHSEEDRNQCRDVMRRALAVAQVHILSAAAADTR